MAEQGPSNQSVCSCSNCLKMQRTVTTMLNELDKKNNQLQALMLQLALARSQNSAA